MNPKKQGKDGGDPDGIFQYPSTSKRRQPKRFGEVVPEALQRSYEATVRAFSDANYLATVVGCRRTLEGIFKYQLPDELRQEALNTLIDQVRKTKDLAEPLETLSHAIREGGNLGAHFDPEREPSSDVARQMIDLLEYLIEFLYLLPKEIKELEIALTTTKPVSSDSQESARAPVATDQADDEKGNL